MTLAKKSKAGLIKVMLFVLIAATLFGCVAFADWWIAKPVDTRSSYVGRDTCAQCHQTQLDSWTGSDHDLAQIFMNTVKHKPSDHRLMPQKTAHVCGQMRAIGG